MEKVEKVWANHPDLGLELERILRENAPGLHELRDQKGLLVGFVQIEPPPWVTRVRTPSSE